MSLKNMRARRKPAQKMTRVADHQPSREVSTPSQELIELETLILDADTQPRESCLDHLITEYAERMSSSVSTALPSPIIDPEGKPWPPITVHTNGTQTWLTDGFHRYHAARHAGLTHFQVIRISGEYRDAIAYTLGVNADHGQRRTRADKRRVVARALRDDEWRSFSDRRLAKMCKVTHKTVASIRQELEAAGEIPFELELFSADDRGTSRTPPAPLDRDGYIQPERASVTAKHTDREGEGDVNGVADTKTDTDRLDALIMYPSALKDYEGLVDRVMRSMADIDRPAIVITSLSQRSKLMWQGPALLDRIVSELGFDEPRVVRVVSHDRMYFVWARHRDLDHTYAVDTDLLERGSKSQIVGKPLSAWDAVA